VAKEARANREGWKDPHDTSLDQRLEVILKFFTPQASLESVTKQKLYAFVMHLEQRKGRDGKAPQKYIHLTDEDRMAAAAML
jgi:hypothetical protein